MHERFQRYPFGYPASLGLIATKMIHDDLNGFSFPTSSRSCGASNNNANV
jgi:hypothetical protein